MQTKRILLLDDDPVTLSAVSRLLTRHHHRTTQCSDTAQGVALAVRGGWDLIILDLSMDSPRPEIITEFDGLKLLGWLKKAHRATPVILLTGNESAQLEHRAKAVGAFAVVRKSEPPGRLLAAVKDAAEPREEPELPEEAQAIATPADRSAHS